MRVVNDRRRLPRVAWSGNAVIQTRRGELRGVGLDLSADGMAVLAPTPVKAKERIRIHAQLGDFPLLTDARVVRMTKRRDGYRWAIRFERMDQRMRANLEAYVRHQLAAAARYRQAQLYAERLKGGALAPPPPMVPTVPHASLPTPGPMPRIEPEQSVDPSQPLVDIGVSAPLESPIEEEPAAEPDAARPLEIELPDMGEHQGPALDVSPIAEPAGDQVFVPYQATEPADEAELLGEGPLTPAPGSSEESSPLAAPVAAAPEPAATRGEPSASLDVAQDVVAKTITPGVIEIDDDEELSLEDILAEVEGGTAAPATDLNLPPPQEDKPETSGLGDVLMLDEDLGDDEETRRRPSELPGMTGAPDEDEGTTLRMKEDIKPPPQPGAAAPELLPDGESDATVAISGLEGAPSSKPTLIGHSKPVASSPIELDDDDSSEISIDDLSSAPALAGAPLTDAPELVGEPLDVAEPVADAPALVGAPLDVAEPMTDAPALVDAAEAASDAALVDGLPPPLGPSTPVPGAPVEVEPEPSMSDAPALIEPDAPRPRPTPAPSTPTFAAHPSPFYDGPADEPEPEPEPDIPEPFSDIPPSHVQTAAADESDASPEPPALLGEAPPELPQKAARGTPLPSSATFLYGDAEPFDPYAPNPEPPAGSAAPKVGSAPRALGELPPMVQGLYTPASNPSLDEEPSGAYAAASFEPFPSPEEGLYGDRSDVPFMEAQGNPRQRLAMLQADDPSDTKDEEHDLFLGDIEGVTSGLTPTAYKRSLTDEVLDPPEDEQDGVDPTSIKGAPGRAEAEPTRPVDVGPAEFTPPPKDLTPPPHDLTPPPQQAEFTPPPEELSLDDVEFEDADGAAPTTVQPDAGSSPDGPGFPTYPEFNVIPDFDQSAPPGDEPPDFEPAQSGKTMVASLESLGMLRPPDDGPMPAPSAPPSDFSVLPSFGGSGASQGTGFTVVAAFDDGGEDKAGTLSGSTMIASAEDVEAWKRAAQLNGAPALDDVRTVSYTPPPGSLDPATKQPGAVPSFGGPSINEDALTAMRVGRGGAPSSAGAGFQLNPRGPAPGAPPSSPVARVPLAQVAVPRTPRPDPTMPIPSAQPAGRRPDPTMPIPSSPPSGETLPASARPTLPPSTAAPGPSSRRRTELAPSGRPAPVPPRQPPTKGYPAVPLRPAARAEAAAGAQPPAKPALYPSSQPTPPAQPIAAKPAAAPQPAASASPTTRRSMVEDALAQLKKKTAEKRKTGPHKATEGVETKPKISKKEAARQRRRRRLGQAELTDPALAELYKAAMTDLERHD